MSDLNVECIDLQDGASLITGRLGIGQVSSGNCPRSIICKVYEGGEARVGVDEPDGRSIQQYVIIDFVDEKVSAFRFGFNFANGFRADLSAMVDALKVGSSNITSRVENHSRILPLLGQIVGELGDRLSNPVLLDEIKDRPECATYDEASPDGLSSERFGSIASLCSELNKVQRREIQEAIRKTQNLLGSASLQIA